MIAQVPALYGQLATDVSLPKLQAGLEASQPGGHPPRSPQPAHAPWQQATDALDAHIDSAA